MGKINVIHADDHDILRYGIRRYLTQHEDIELVGEASNGKECIQLFKQLRPHVCIVDIEMPDVNGIEAARTIREIEPDAKLLILSMHTDNATIQKAKEAGASDREIHDTVLIAAAFCMYNRYVDGLATVAPQELEAYDEMGAVMAEEGYTRVRN